MPVTPAEISVIQHAYRLDLKETDWLQELAAAARPILDRGFGVGVYTYDATSGTRLNIGAAAVAGCDESIFRALYDMHEHLADNASADMFQAYAGAPVATFSEKGSQAFMQAIHDTKTGALDMLGLSAGDPTGLGVAMVALLDRRQRYDARFVNRWSRIGAHMAAGFRARRALTAHHQPRALPSTSDRNDDANGKLSAVLKPSGEVVHAEGAARPKRAREALKAAALASERARACTDHRNVDEAIEVWRGLVSGQWSLLEEFESDGRRYLVARRNDPQVRSPSALGQRERQIVGFRAMGHPLKLISYELGLSISSVSATLRRTMKRLGIHSEADLVQLSADTASRETDEVS